MFKGSGVKRSLILWGKGEEIDVSDRCSAGPEGQDWQEISVGSWAEARPCRDFKATLKCLEFILKSKESHLRVSSRTTTLLNLFI